MTLKKTHKTKKVKKMHGKNQGTHGWGARRAHKKSGHRGGVGMAGTGKRNDQKKTLVLKKYGHGYFGKKGITSLSHPRDTSKKINVGDIQKNYSPGKIDFGKYKILGTGELKGKFIITAKAASKSAIAKIKKAGGEIILPKVKEIVKVVKKEEDKKAGEVKVGKKEGENKEKGTIDGMS